MFNIKICRRNLLLLRFIKGAKNFEVGQFATASYGRSCAQEDNSLDALESWAPRKSIVRKQNVAEKGKKKERKAI